METTQHTEKLDDAVGEPKIEESLKRKREEDEIDASKRVRIEDDVTEGTTKSVPALLICSQRPPPQATQRKRRNMFPRVLS